MTQWYDEDLERFDPEMSHPGWAGASPTGTADVCWFAVEPAEAWRAFRIPYDGGDMSLRHRRRGATVEVECYQAGAPQEHLEEVQREYDASNIELDVEDERWRVSLWVVDGRGMAGFDTGPVATECFRLDEDGRLGATFEAKESTVTIGVWAGYADE